MKEGEVTRDIIVVTTKFPGKSSVSSNMCDERCMKLTTKRRSCF